MNMKKTGGFTAFFVILTIFWAINRPPSPPKIPSSSGTPTPPETLSLPETWKGIKLPEIGLKEVLPSSNENGFYADYSGITREELIINIFTALDASGFEKVCEKLDGELLGFRRDDEQLVMKIDLFGDIQALSLFDKNGSDPILHGICFAGYEVGPEIRMR